ncbi:MAG: hypothetical protein U0795_17505 [Pirellulales bacterium]
MADQELNADEPIAFFLTWTTYGTWLPGDERGSWHRRQYQLPNELLRQMAAAEMKESEFQLSQADRDVVERTIARHCAIRAWKLHTVNARSNHVHVVVTARVTSRRRFASNSRRGVPDCSSHVILTASGFGQKAAAAVGSITRMTWMPLSLTSMMAKITHDQNDKHDAPASESTSTTRQRVRPQARRASE